MAFISLILGIIVGAGAIVFALQNNDVVALSFLNYQFESSLAVVIVLALIAGFILALLLAIPSVLSRSFKIMSLEREKRGLAGAAEDARREKELADAKLAAQEAADAGPVVDLRQ